MQSMTKLAIGLLGAAAYFGFRRRRQGQDLRGKTALITGSSRGLGFLLAREYAREGCRVVICARDEGELDVARDALRDEGASVLAVTCDVSNEFEVRALVDEATRHFGGVDILVNNAGVIQMGPVEDQSLEDFEEALGTMFYGVLMPIWSVLPQMIRRGDGRIVNITSIGGKLSVPHLLPYNCAKFAAVGLSEGLRAELGRSKISVTTIVPGLMRTGSFINAVFKGRRTGEYAWFSLASSLPLISMNAERAARQIVAASRKRKAEHIVGAPAKLAALFHGIFPGTTSNLLRAVNTLLLPRPNGHGSAAVPGKFVQPQLSPPIERILAIATLLGRRAAQRYQ